jgi:hypothetical protein
VEEGLSSYSIAIEEAILECKLAYWERW